MEVNLISGEKTDSSCKINVPDFIFGLEPREDILQRAVLYHLAARQRGTHFAKTRADVSRTGKKSVRQKGTGGARHGPRSVNLFRGGGKTFGPVVRSHAIQLTKKFRKLALRHALSARCRSGTLLLIDPGCLKFDKISTKQARLLYKQCCPKGGSCLIFDAESIEDNFYLSSRNLRELAVRPCSAISTYDVLHCDWIILSREAVQYLIEEKFYDLSLEAEEEGTFTHQDMEALYGIAN